MENNKSNELKLSRIEINKLIDNELKGLKFTKNFRSLTAEEWYIFLSEYHDPVSGGAAGKAIIHYDLLGNRDVFINTTIIFDDLQLHKSESYPLVYAVVDEIINRLVGYADTLVSVHSGDNSYQAEYVE
jgi:hypothetical protein